MIVKFYFHNKHSNIFVFFYYKECVSSIICSKDGKKIYSGSWDSYIKIWNSDTLSEIKTIFTKHNGKLILLLYEYNKLN